MAACETEACSPLVSFNINGFPDRSAGRTGREKTRQIAGGDRFSVELLKYAPYQNAKQLKGSPYFSRRPPDGAALPTVGKTSPSTFIPLLYFSCFPSSLPVFLPSLHVVIFLALCFLFTSLSRFFLPFFCTLFFVTYCFPSLDLDLSSLHPVFLSSSSITPLNFPAVRHEAPQHSSFIFFPPTRPSPLLPSFLSLSPLLFSFLFLCPSTVPSFLLPSPFSFLSSVALSFVWLKHQYSGDWPRRWLRKAFHIHSPLPLRTTCCSFIPVCLPPSCLLQVLN